MIMSRPEAGGPEEEDQAARRCRSAISTPIAFKTDGRLRCFW
jgi:hypothetical protein